MTVLVVGAGISGVAAARRLGAAGVGVRMVDRGRVVGGRMASRRDDGRVADTGASYLTASDDGFVAVLEDWRRRGLARPWTDTFHATGDQGLEPHSGPVRWAAPGGLRSLVVDLADGLDVTSEVTVERVGPGPTADGTSYDAVLLAMPDPQARRLLDPALADDAAALDDPFAPTLALTARWAERGWPDLDGVFVNDHPLLSWVADDGRRRGDDAPVLVAHSTPQLAAEHLADPRAAAADLETAVRDVLGIAGPAERTHVHRWTFAKPTGTRDVRYHLGASMVGVCGDAWSDKPRVEAAWLSGTALADAVLERLAAS